jgi:hypothetical protein
MYGCSSDDNVTEPSNNSSATEYFPLKVGNLWLYKNPSSSLETDQKWEVISKNSRDIYIIREDHYNPSDTITSYIYLKADDNGIGWYDDNNNKNGYLMKLPYDVNNSWEVSTSSNDAKLRFTITQKNVIYNTEYGNYTYDNCLVVKYVIVNSDGSIDAEDDFIFVYSKDIGLVAMEEGNRYCKFYSLL